MALDESDKQWLLLTLENAALKTKEKQDEHVPESKRIRALEKIMWVGHGVVGAVLTGIGIWEARK